MHVELEDDSIDPSYIVEGDTITFKCLIQAHPWVWRIVWYRDGEKLVPSDGVVIEEHRLTLKNATKKMSGQYICSAANVEGDGFRYGGICVLIGVFKNPSVARLELENLFSMSKKIFFKVSATGCHSAQRETLCSEGR